MSSDGYEQIPKLVAENPARETEELVKMATDDGHDADDAHQWAKDGEVAGDGIERGGKYWVVWKGEFAFGEFDHPV